MNKKNVLMLLCGVLAGSLCFGSVGVISAIEYKAITVSYDNIKLVIDGKQVTPKDATGKVVEPFIHEGTTYLPVRAVAEALGKDVKWDGPAKTVIIGDNLSDDAKKSVMLHDLKELRREGFLVYPIKITDNYDKNYTGFLRPTYTPTGKAGFIEYVLDGKYSKMKGRLILDDRSRSLKSAETYTIIADGKTLITLEALQPGDKPVDFEVDLEKCYLLRIEVSYGAQNWGTNAFVNMELFE